MRAKAANQCDAQTEFFVWTSLQPFHGGDVVTCFDVVGCGVRWNNVVGCEVTWDEVMWLVARCHVNVMWFDVMSFDVMWSLVLCYVTWCNAMSCDVPSCDEMSSVVKWRDAMGRGLPSLWCDVAGCDVTLRGSKWLCDVGNWKMIWSVLQRNTSTAQYYKVLLRTTQFYKVLLRTTQFYKVLLRTSQHYKLRQCTTLHYTLHSTTTHYKVLLTPYYKVWLRTTKYYKDTTPYDKASICLIDATHETPSTLREATGVTFELHQSLRLPRKMILMIDPPDISNVIYIVHLHCAEHQDSPSNITKYCACHEKWLSWLILLTFEPSINNARSTKKHPPTSPNIVPATKNDSHDWSCSHLKRHLQCAEQDSPSNVTFQNMKKICWMKTDEASFTMADNARMIRAWSEHELAISHPPPSPSLLFTLWRRILYVLRLSTQISPNAAPATKIHTPTSPNVAPAMKSETPTSPNILFATKNDSHDWSSSDMKRHLH